MATPTADTYTAPTGTAVVRGGIAAPGGGLNLSGTVWTPNRDGSGNVLSSDFTALPTMTWLTVAGSASTLNSAIETPHYYKSSGPSDGSVNITRAWSGAAWDYTNQIMYLQGGGHGDTSVCENGLYALSAAKLTWTRARNRSPTSAWQQFNAGTQAFDTVNTNPNASLGQGGGSGENCPLQDGSSSAVHNYDQLVWVPGSVMGNTNGAVYQGGRCRTVWDLDTNTFKTAHYYNEGTYNATTNPYASGVDWMGGGFAYVDGGAVHHQRAANNFFRYVLSGSEATYWSATSFGQLIGEGTSSAGLPSQYHSCRCVMRERREYVFISYDGGGNPVGYRVRYGERLDAGVTGSTNWNSHTDVIAFTSVNGTDHLDFNSTTLFDPTVVSGGSTLTHYMASAGLHYDHATTTIYVQGNDAGTRLYKITGIATNTWTVEKLASTTAALTDAWQFTFGRFRIADLFGTKLAMRVVDPSGPLEVLRIS